MLLLGIFAYFFNQPNNQETASRLAPGQPIGRGRQAISNPSPPAHGSSDMRAVVDLQDVDSGATDADSWLELAQRGAINLNEAELALDGLTFANLQLDSRNQPLDPTVQKYNPDHTPSGSLLPMVDFNAIDYHESQQGVPPDMDIMVGNQHVVVGTNGSIQVFDKSGNSLKDPTLYKNIWGENCGTGSNTLRFFDPFSVYDESAERYVLGITAFDIMENGGNSGYLCIAISTTDSATGEWYLYSFTGNPNPIDEDDVYFLDYPQIGIGQEAIFVSANMFEYGTFIRNHIFAFDKAAMYAGDSVPFVKLSVGTDNFMLQPAKLKGFATGGWPTNPDEPHYFVDAQVGTNNLLTVWAFSDPWGTPIITKSGTIAVNDYYVPIPNPQDGGNLLNGNDNRLQDVEYWNGRLWTTHTIGCNPAGETVNCVRWYELDVRGESPTLVQQGTFGSAEIFRAFPNLAVNRCGDMLVGYSHFTENSYPSVYVAGREVHDPVGLLKDETLLKAGESVYIAYYSAPYRWGDYSGMALDPDGKTLWYVGEYSKNQVNADWATWIGAYRWAGCSNEPTAVTMHTTATQSQANVPMLTIILMLLASISFSRLSPHRHL